MQKWKFTAIFLSKSRASNITPLEQKNSPPCFGFETDEDVCEVEHVQRYMFLPGHKQLYSWICRTRFRSLWAILRVFFEIKIRVTRHDELTREKSDSQNQVHAVQFFVETFLPYFCPMLDTESFELSSIDTDSSDWFPERNLCLLMLSWRNIKNWWSDVWLTDDIVYLRLFSGLDWLSQWVA